MDLERTNSQSREAETGGMSDRDGTGAGALLPARAGSARVRSPP